MCYVECHASDGSFIEVREVGRPVILEAVSVIWSNLFLLKTDSMVKKQGE